MTLHHPHLGMFYFQLSHLDQVLTKGYNTPCLEAGELYKHMKPMLVGNYSLKGSSPKTEPLA